MEELINKIKRITELSAEAEEYFYSIGTKKSVQKGDILIRHGEIVKKNFYVLSGCLRSYCIDKNGKEHTLQFAIKEWWISDYIAINTNELGTLNVDCLMDSTIVEFNAQKLNEIHALYPAFGVFQRISLERHMVSLHKRILNQLQLTALERYELFLEQYPDIEKNTPNYHIASYLGITQQSLSRLRVEKAKN